jgi:hypothetical protein
MNWEVGWRKVLQEKSRLFDAAGPSVLHIKDRADLVCTYIHSTDVNSALDDRTAPADKSSSIIAAVS